VKSGYLKPAQFSPKPASVVNVATVLRILKNLRNPQGSKNESHSDTEHILFYFILLQFCFLQIYYFVLHYMWGIFHHAYAKDAPFAYLCNFYCCQ
jgi:hypothetical protein